MSIDATNMSPEEHQALVRENIEVSLRSGDLERANILRHCFAELLAMEFGEGPHELSRIAGKEGQ